jgi:hypothetical protein
LTNFERICRKPLGEAQLGKLGKKKEREGGVVYVEPSPGVEIVLMSAENPYVHVLSVLMGYRI